MNIRETFALNLRTLRNAKGLSQEELALRANVHRTYVSSLERCVYSPTIDMVDGLAQILGVEAFEMLVSKRNSGEKKTAKSGSESSSAV
ncbi:helix-turn-helix transcriptional regulator [Agrobacterium sp. SHOUNA12C]|uniref:Helix-turn-helix domain-containing protein n=1 Tax=Ensifer canadensis TaxID=555315 RepID=A0AAW4FUJ1_9HYPH|nr:helix-turn-helix transcriptional regulator [Ensifer canadensis]MBM3095004.1 helix-turn-helix domain-containing protein [Ensifer canadensis]MCJ9722243.1 helix-turn-helix transcriptional regulator [Agrobacterium sp. BETTINA12B]MCJ9757105.1 helix-turn-helix transcriptional regulator [Agrobacterium sp. SHOUNA12C]UBI81010.1 helix-turn-helix transcriptional regulator [Ensifer canadensis]